MKAEHFDLAIFDVRLVDDAVYNIQGIALLEEAKKLHPLMKTIILTGYPDPKQKAKALDSYGADGYLEKAPRGKPFDFFDGFSQLIFDLLQK